MKLLQGGHTGEVSRAGAQLTAREQDVLNLINLFADDNWEDQWGLVGTVATWGRALTGDEIAGMGGWIGGAATPTPLVIPEPATLSLLALGGLLCLIRRIRK